MQELKLSILEYLQNMATGRKNTITSLQMSHRFHAPEVTVRKAIADLISEGHAIASAVRCPAGYYIPVTRSEAEECLQHLRSRTREIYLRGKNLERALAKKFGSDQLSLGIEMRELSAQ